MRFFCISKESEFELQSFSCCFESQLKLPRKLRSENNRNEKCHSKMEPPKFSTPPWRQKRSTMGQLKRRRFRPKLRYRMKTPQLRTTPKARDFLFLYHVEIFENETNHSRKEVIAEETAEIAPAIEVTPDSTNEEVQELEGQAAEEATTAAETEQRKMFKYM